MEGGVGVGAALKGQGEAGRLCRTSREVQRLTPAARACMPQHQTSRGEAGSRDARDTVFWWFLLISIKKRAFTFPFSRRTGNSLPKTPWGPWCF